MKRIHHELTAAICQAMASPMRIRALTLLAQGAWSVGQLAAELGESIASTSAHLKVLRNAHLIDVEKKGREVWCQMRSPQVVSALAAIQRAAETVLPEFREAIQQMDKDPFLATDIDLNEVAAEAAAGTLALVDLRPETEFLAGHLPKAISRPFTTLPDVDLNDLRDRQRVIAYCRGPWCKKAKEGVKLLNERGVPSQRLRGGVIEWQAAGLKLEH